MTCSAICMTAQASRHLFLFTCRSKAMFLIAPVVQHPTLVDQSQIVDIACRRAGLTQDRVARIYGVSPQQFSQQVRGIGHLSVRRLMAMAIEEDGRKFLREYWPLAAEAMGMVDIAEALAWRDQFVQLIGKVQVHMLKAQLRERKAEESEEGVA